MISGKDEAGVIYRYRFGAVEFNEADDSLGVDGVRVAIEPRPLAVLQALLRQPRVVLPKEELVSALWGREEIALSDNALPNAVSKLRRALGNDSRAIRTIAGTGYMFDAPLERMVVARSAYPELQLSAGMPVPGSSGYLLQRELGVTPRHAVWLAQHLTDLPAQVFKFCASGPGLARLKREYTLSRLLVASLGVRYDIVRISDTNFAEAPYWIKSDYGGINLIGWSEDGHLAPLSREERLGLIAEIAAAVADAHSADVVHGDLKPANVLMATDDKGCWHPRLTDFGGGRLLDPDRLQKLQITGLGLTVSDVASAGAQAGTMLYAAPELLSGLPANPRSDLYALGVMAYQLVIGDLRAPMASGWEQSVSDPLLAADLVAATHGIASERPDVANWLKSLTSLETRRFLNERNERLLAAEQRRRAQRPFKAGALVALLVALVASLWSWQRTRTALVQTRSRNNAHRPSRTS